MSEQRKIIHDDNNGLDYVLVGDYYIPMLALPEETRPIGYWGMLRKEYLKKHKSGMYSYLLLTGKLDSYLADLNEQAQERYELIEAQMRSAEGVTEKLKAQNPMECSRSEEKQDILKTLFQMERWSSINGWLTDKLNQKRNALDLLKQQMAADLRSLNEESMQAAQQTYASLTEQIVQDNEQKNALLQQQENVQADLLQQKEYHRWKEDYKLKQQQCEKEKQQEGQMKQQKEQVLRCKQMQQLRHMYQEMQRLQKAKELRKAQYIQAKDRKQKASQQYACLDEQNKSIQGYEEQIQTAREQLLQCEEQLRLLKTFGNPPAWLMLVSGDFRHCKEVQKARIYFLLCSVCKHLILLGW